MEPQAEELEGAFGAQRQRRTAQVKRAKQVVMSYRRIAADNGQVGRTQVEVIAECIGNARTRSVSLLHRDDICFAVADAFNNAFDALVDAIFASSVPYVPRQNAERFARGVGWIGSSLASVTLLVASSDFLG